MAMPIICCPAEPGRLVTVTTLCLATPLIIGSWACAAPKFLTRFTLGGLPGIAIDRTCLHRMIRGILDKRPLHDIDETAFGDHLTGPDAPLHQFWQDVDQLMGKGHSGRPIAGQEQRRHKMH